MSSKRIDALLRWATAQLHQSESGAFDARVLLASALEKPHSYLLTWPEAELSESQHKLFADMVTQRQQGKPVAHILGFRDFWTLRLAVNPFTLIPRPETELLVEQALDLALPTKANVLDLGTGTGAIALALASERPEWAVTGVDKVSQAVELATENARNNAIANASFVRSDWFDGINASRFDLIVSNPPYVEASSPYLKQGDVRFEPASALTAGEDGLDDIRTIVEQAQGFLCDTGWLMIEHGFEQHTQVQSLMASAGYTAISSKQDLNGLPRLTMGCKSH